MSDTWCTFYPLSLAYVEGGELFEHGAGEGAVSAR